ncbi:MAG: hypothetical protein J3K34DRAFT_523779 [Monoraphidium minutum]|nr:MAG: hypothetical protein J3K34DRAFT_523779 [Monoraphidium minutum]
MGGAMIDETPWQAPDGGAGARPAAAMAAAVAPAAAPFALLDLPRCVLELLMASHLSLEDTAQWMAACPSLKAVAEAALARRTAWSSDDMAEPSPEALAQVLSFLARYCPSLNRVSAVLPHRAAAPPPPPAIARGLRALGGAGGGRLRGVALINAGAGDAELEALAADGRALRHLAVGSTGGDATGGPAAAGAAAVAAGCPHLRSLSLLGCPALGDAALAALAPPPRGAGAGGRPRPALRGLALHRCGGVTDGGLAGFLAAAGGRLRVLEVSAAPGGGARGAFGPEACAAAAAHCTALQVLRVSEEHLSNSATLDDGALCGLARALGPRLSDLELASVDAGAALLNCLADSCPGLRSLSLDRTRAGDGGLAAAAAGCRELRELRVRGGGPHAWLMPSELAPPGLTLSGLLSVSQRTPQLSALEVSGLSPDPYPDAAAAATAAAAAAADGIAAAAAATLDAAFASGAAEAGPAASAAAAAAARAPVPPLLAPELCGRLSRLSLDWIKADPEAVQSRLAAALRGCGRLRRLSLEGYQGDVTELLAALAAAGAPLEAAALAHTRAGAPALRLLAGAFGATLVDVRLSYCAAVDDGGVAALAGLPRLATLDLYQVPSVSVAAVVELAASAPALATLHLGHHTASASRPPGARGWGGARAPGAADHLAPVLAAAAARRRAGSGGGGGSGSGGGGSGAALRVLLRDPAGDATFDARAAARAAALS